MATLGAITKVVAVSRWPVEDVLEGRCVPTVVPSLEPSHVDNSILVVLEVGTELACWTLPVEVDSGWRKDIAPLDWLVPSGVPEYVVARAPTGYGEREMLFVMTAVSIDDSPGTMVPVDKRRSLVLPLPVGTDWKVASPTVVSAGAISVGVSLKEVPTVVLVLWLLLGSLELGFMVSSDVPGVLLDRPVTEIALQLGSLQGGKKGVLLVLILLPFSLQICTYSVPLDGRNPIVHPCV